MAREYTSPMREKKAEETKVRVCLAAAPLFAEHGYAATSMRTLASAAGTSMDTIYGMGGKAEVFLRTLEISLSGLTDGTPLFDRPDLLTAPDSGTLRDALAAFTSALTEADRRSIGLWSAFAEGANTDPVLAAAFAQRVTDMRAEAHRLIHRLAGWGLCRVPEDIDRTADLLWTAAHPSNYLLLVRHAGWSPEEFERWLLGRFLELLE